MNFAERLKLLRIERDMTQSELAEMLTVERTTVGKWERVGFVPNTDILKALANYFNVTLDFLLGNSELGYIVLWDKDNKEILTYKDFQEMKNKNEIILADNKYYYNPVSNHPRKNKDNVVTGEIVDKDLDFKFALYGEVKDLSEEQRQLIMQLARNLKGK